MSTPNHQGKFLNYALYISVFINLLFIAALGYHYYRAHKVPSPSAKDYYLHTETVYAQFPINKNDIVFFGDSHTKRFDLTEYFPGLPIKNRGIEGDISAGLLNRINQILPGKPAKVFLQIGYNDLGYEITPDSVYKNIKLIVDRIKTESPETKIYISSVFPSEIADMDVQVKDKIPPLNEKIKQLCQTDGIPFIDVYNQLSANGALNPKYSGGDGVHLNGPGYNIWANALKPYLTQ